MNPTLFDEIKSRNIDAPEPPTDQVTPLQTLLRCRVCLETRNDLENMFNEETSINPNHADKIIRCVCIEIKKDDGFPQKICTGCILLLESAYQFKVICEQSDQTLKMEARTDSLFKNGLSTTNPKVDDTNNEIPIPPNLPMKIDIECGENTSDSETIGDKYNDTDDPVDSDWTDNKNLTTTKLKLAKPVKQPKLKLEKGIKKEKKKRIRKKYKAIKNYQCEECGFMTRGPTALEDHKRYQHQGILTFYKCQKCTKSFKKQSLLQHHLNIVHDVNPVVCDICGKTKKNELQLKMHREKVHFPTKRFKCQYCEYEALNGVTIRKHMTMHTGERNFSCDICNKTFRLNQTLTAHIRKTHYNLRPFQVSNSWTRHFFV